MKRQHFPWYAVALAALIVGAVALGAPVSTLSGSSRSAGAICTTQPNPVGSPQRDRMPGYVTHNMTASCS